MVDFPVTLSHEMNGKWTKHEAINPEPGTRNLLIQTDRMSNLWAILRAIKVYGYFYLMNNYQVWFKYNVCPEAEN
jgi:hypothetical protein